MKKFILLHLLIAGCALLNAAALNDKAPAFLLPDAAHKKHALSDYKGKIVFINFWASWCGPCQSELPELHRLAAEYKGKKFQLIAINVDRDHADAQKLLDQIHLRDSALQILWDPQAKTASAYNIDGMPASFILDAHGIIRYEHVGFRTQDPAHWRTEIAALINPPK